MAISELTQWSRVNRYEINEKLSKMVASFPISIANGGTGSTTVSEAVKNLGGRIRVTLYSNSSGTTGTVQLSSTIYGTPEALGIYYGYGDIKRYFEYDYVAANYYHSYSDSYTPYFTLGLHYLTASENLVIRKKRVYCELDNINRLTDITRQPSDFFSTDGTNWTSTEKLSIYKVVGFFQGGY